MKIISIQKRIGLMLLAFVLINNINAATFTASNTGSFSSTATWTGGVVPPSTVLLDQIVIPSGITVDLDNNLSINGSLASLDVAGTLTTSNNSSLTITLGTLSGAGNIALNAVAINSITAFTFTGTLSATTLNSTTGFQSSAGLIVGQTLNLTAGTLSLVSGGSLDVNSTGTIVVSGGLLSLGVGGSLGLTGNYNVTYSGVSSLAGAELNGSGLKNVTIAVSGGNSVTLTSDLTVAGTLALTSGSIVLAGKDLAINGPVAAGGSGVISSNALSNVSINTSAGTVGVIRFGGLTPSVNNLAVNVAAGNQAFIGGTLTVSGTLKLNSGVLNFSNTDLSITGNISGAGALSGSNTSNLAINTLVASSSALNFVSGGQSVRNLNISVSATNAPTLVSDLTVYGTLTLSGVSTLNLNGKALVLGAASNLTGSGAIVSNATSDLTINSTVGIPSLLIVGTVGNFTVNTGSSNVNLASSLTTNGMLTLQSGVLKLNGYNFTINGNVAASGTGTISSTSTSNVALTSSSSPAGSLRFASTANTVGSLTVNIGNNGTASLSTDLQVRDTLRFTSGKLSINGNALIINSVGAITGSDTGSYVITGTSGYLEQRATAGGSGAVNFPVGTPSHYAPANIHLNTGSTSGQVQVGVVADVMAKGVSGFDFSSTQPVVDATWHVNSTIASNLNLNLEVMWSAAMEVNGFNRTAAYISHYTNSNWDVSATSGSSLGTNGMYSIQKTAITSLSPFAVFNQNTATAIDELSNNIQFNIFPNPTNDKITIQNSFVNSEAMNVDIYNTFGQKVGSYKLMDAISTISVKELENGNYFIKFYNNKMSSTKRFIKM